MSKFFSGIVAWFKRLPVAKFIKPLWKPALAALVNAELDSLGNALKIAVERDGPRAVDRNVDAFQAKVISGLDRIKFLPEAFKAPVKEIVQEQGDMLQKSMRASVENYGPRGVQAVIDAAKEIAASKISAL